MIINVSSAALPSLFILNGGRSFQVTGIGFHAKLKWRNYAGAAMPNSDLSVFQNNLAAEDGLLCLAIALRRDSVPSRGDIGWEIMNFRAL